ncbi:MAG: CHAT domain-containing protein [Anaerolineae bacterium]|nr:CHAT domain-containing protein [Anaerolineae bacterium]
MTNISTRVSYHYQDFILKLCRTDLEYLVEAYAPGGERKKRPIRTPQWDNNNSATFTHYFKQHIEQVERDQAKTQIVANAEIRQFGSQLFQCLFSGAILVLYRKSLQSVWKASGDGTANYAQGLRIILDLSQTPELTRIPWEFLYDEEKEGDKFLCLDPRTPIVRRLRLGTRQREINAPLLFLLLGATPSGQNPLGKVLEEIRSIEDILGKNPHIQVRPHRLAASAADLLKAMQNWPHIVHFTGHGSSGRLAFDDQELSANQIRQLLEVNQALRLMVINACEAGQSVTETLARSGIPAIIAMQFEITDQASTVFAKEFYEHLAVGLSIETCLSFARLAMGMAIRGVESYEWATPVLYLQTTSEEVLGDTLITAKEPSKVLDQMSPPDAEERVFRFLLHEGQIRNRQGSHGEALAFLEEAKRLWKPPYGETNQDIDKYIRLSKVDLEEKRRRNRAALSKDTLFEKARSYAEEKEWEKTRNLLETIGQLQIRELSSSAQEIDYSFPSQELSIEMNELYQRAYKELERAAERQARLIRLETFYHQAEKGYREENWDEAIIFFDQADKELKGLKWLNTNVENYQDAEEKATEAKKQKRLRYLYQEGSRLAEQEKWRDAIEIFKQIAELDSSFQGAKQRLKELRQEKEQDDTYRQGMEDIRISRLQIAIEALQTVPVGARRYQDAQLALKYAQGWLEMEREQWSQAVDNLNAVVVRRPDFEGNAQQLYEEALYRRGLQIRYQSGCQGMDNEQWQEARAALQWVKDQQRARTPKIYPDVDQRLDQIEKEMRLADQYQQAQRFFDTENWERAISLLQTILKERDRYKDSREKLNLAQKQQNIEVAYQRGIEATLQDQWLAAIEAFEEVLSLQNDHEDAQRRLETARRNQTLGENYHQGIQAFNQGESNSDISALERAIKHLDKVVLLDETFRDAAARLKEAQHLLEAERNYQAALRAEEGEDWVQAVKFWQQVTDLARELNRDYRNSANRLKRAIQQKELADLYRQAQTHRDNEAWAEAEAVLVDLIKRASDYNFAPYKDAHERLAEAKQQAKIAELFENGQLCMRTERWRDAITLFNEVLKLNSNHLPTQDLLIEAKRQDQRDTEYQIGLAAFQAGKWLEAIQHLEVVYNEDKNYKDVAARLETAHHQQKLATRYNQGVAYANQSEWDQAFACFDDVKRDDPNFLNVQSQWQRTYEYKELNRLYHLARKLEDEGKLEEAIKYYDEVEKRSQNVQQL